MTFSGAKFLFICVAIQIGLFCSALLFAMTYNLFINPENSSAHGWTIALLVISILLASLIVWLSYKILYKIAVPVIAGLGGAFGFMMLYALTGW